MLEVKKSEKEYLKKDARQYLQEHTLKTYALAGAYTSFIFPENEEVILADLHNL